MKRAIAMAMIASTLLVGLAAAQPSGQAKAAAKGAEASAGAARSMDAPYLAVPVVRDGQLTNYLFVSIRIEIAPGVDLWRTREQAHFLRDALVRACHTNRLDDPNDPSALNQARALEVFHAAAVQALGERAVGRISIVATQSSRGQAS